MSSSEYHKCMSEVYFTRTLLWMFEAAYVYEHVTKPHEMWLVAAIAILAVGNFICLYMEQRSAR